MHLILGSLSLQALLLALLLSRNCEALPQLAKGGCRWDDFQTDGAITSWEFQLRSTHDTNRTRAEWEALVERSFAAAASKLPEFRMDRSSKRAMIWRESAHRLTTDDARPLDPAAKANVSFPWRQAAVLRLRDCVAVEAPLGEKHPRHLLKPGQADLTMKLKDVEDPATFPDYKREFPQQVGKAWLEAKLENDVHCDYRHVSYSAVFRRTRGVREEDTRTLAGVAKYFRGLSDLMALPESFPLPLVFDHWQSKTYWDVDFDAMHGTVQLYLNSTDREAAVSGSSATMMEMSMRLARKDAHGSAGRLADSLQLIVRLCEALGRHGWTSTWTSIFGGSVLEEPAGAAEQE